MKILKATAVAALATLVQAMGGVYIPLDWMV